MGTTPRKPFPTIVSPYATEEVQRRFAEDRVRRKATIETEVVVPFLNGFGLLIRELGGWTYLANWLEDQFAGHITDDEVVYGKMRITFEVM